MAFYAQPMVEKLGADNYTSWARDMKYLLNDRNCWNIVTGAEVKPDKDGPELRDFEIRSRMALSAIYLNIEQNLKSIIQDNVSAKIVWEKIKAHYEPDDRAQHMLLFTDFLNCKMKYDENVELFSSRLSFLFSKFKELKDPLPEIYLNFQFLRYLPGQFEHIVRTIMAWPDKDFTFEKIVKEVIAEELRIKVRQIDLEESASAQFSKHNVSNCSKFTKRKGSKFSRDPHPSDYYRKSVSPQRYPSPTQADPKQRTRFYRSPRSPSRRTSPGFRTVSPAAEPNYRPRNQRIPRHTKDSRRSYPSSQFRGYRRRNVFG